MGRSDDRGGRVPADEVEVWMERAGRRIQVYNRALDPASGDLLEQDLRDMLDAFDEDASDGALPGHRPSRRRR